MDTWALVLGGGIWQTDIVRSARRLGLKALVTDITESPPAQSVADLFHRIDTNDREGLEALARTHDVKIVLAEQTDRVVPVAAYLNERLGLNGIRSDVALRFTNKLAMRDALRGAPVKMPRYAEVSTADEAVGRANAWGYPAVLKPKASQSSMGVFKVEDATDLRRRFGETMTVSTDGKILVEEFIDGTEITVEGVSVSGRFHPLAISEKAHYAFNPCVARRLAYPPRFEPDVMERIVRAARIVVETLGLQDGISHAEYRLRGGEPYLVEVAARGGGNRIASSIVPHVSGVDVYETLIRRLLGEPVEIPAPANRAAILSFFSFKPGRVKCVRGLGEARQPELAWELELPFEAGSEIRPTTDDRNRPGYFIAMGRTRDEVDAKAARIESLVQVEYC